MSSSKGNHTPEDTQIIVSMINDLGIHEYEQQVINHLLEFNYSRYPQAAEKKVFDLLFCL